MTELTKTMKRVTVGALDGSHGPDRGRKLVTSLVVGDMIEMRPQGTRRPVRLSLFDAYRYAVRVKVAAIERRAKEIQKRDGGRMASARVKAEKEIS